MKNENADKDVLISRLKAHIFELEQQQRDYDSLNHKYRNCQNE